MATDDVVAGEVRVLRAEVEDVSRTLSAMARTGGFPDSVADAFAKDSVLAEVFLCVGPAGNTQTGIVTALKARGLGASQKTVSRKLIALDEDWDLIRSADRSKAGTLYVQTRLSKDLKIGTIAKRVLKAGK
jgi:hypothetical protein